MPRRSRLTRSVAPKSRGTQGAHLPLMFGDAVITLRRKRQIVLTAHKSIMHDPTIRASQEQSGACSSYAERSRLTGATTEQRKRRQWQHNTLSSGSQSLAMADGTLQQQIISGQLHRRKRPSPTATSTQLPRHRSALYQDIEEAIKPTLASWLDQ